MRFLAFSIGCVLLVASVHAQPSPVPAPMESAMPDLLGPAFESMSAGIAFRPPAGCTQLRKSGAGELIVEYVSEEKKWDLKVSRVILDKPMPLSTPAGGKEDGLLESTIKQITTGNPGATILRQDLTNTADSGGQPNVALIAYRFAAGTDSRLCQQAILQTTPTLYFVFEFKTPGKPVGSNEEVDASERLAVETFTQVLDSVKMLDRASVRRDQDLRIARTLQALVNMNEPKIKSVMVPEQWMRLVRDGKDIGYTYIVEEPETRGSITGVKMGIRSRSYPDKGVQVDAESWLFVSFDRRDESWSNVIVVDDGKGPKKNHMSEFGISQRKNKPTVDNEHMERGKDGLLHPTIKLTDQRTLTVTFVNRDSRPAPLLMALPPAYLPQALGHLLPRLLPIDHPDGYLFWTYVTDQRAVMLRYVDVGREQEVFLDGRKVRAIPIKDRVGLEGSANIHYVTREGKYLGSVNPDGKVQILPTDAATLERLFPAPDLTRPAPQPDTPKLEGSKPEAPKP